MGAQSIQSMQVDFYSPPRASNQVLVGGVIAVATSAVAAALNLQLVNPQPYNPTLADGNLTLGPVGQYITIETDTADLGIVFGPSLASVTGTHAPALATVGTVNGVGTYTDANAICYRIPANGSLRVCLQKERDLFMGFVGSAAGIMRLFQSSPSGITGSL